MGAPAQVGWPSPPQGMHLSPLHTDLSLLHLLPSQHGCQSRPHAGGLTHLPSFTTRPQSHLLPAQKFLMPTYSLLSDHDSTFSKCSITIVLAASASTSQCILCFCCILFHANA